MVTLDDDMMALMEIGKFLKGPHNCGCFLLKGAVVAFRHGVFSRGVRHGALLALLVVLKQHRPGSILRAITSDEDWLGVVNVG